MISREACQPLPALRCRMACAGPNHVGRRATLIPRLLRPSYSRGSQQNRGITAIAGPSSARFGLRRILGLWHGECTCLATGETARIGGRHNEWPRPLSHSDQFKAQYWEPRKRRRATINFKPADHRSGVRADRRLAVSPVGFFVPRPDQSPALTTIARPSVHINSCPLPLSRLVGLGLRRVLTTLTAIQRSGAPVSISPRRPSNIAAALILETASSRRWSIRDTPP